MPLMVENDLQALQVCLSIRPEQDTSTARLVMIQNTSRLGEFYASTALAEEIEADQRLAAQWLIDDGWFVECFDVRADRIVRGDADVARERCPCPSRNIYDLQERNIFQIARPHQVKQQFFVIRPL